MAIIHIFTQIKIPSSPKTSKMGIISWIIFGLLAGLIAKAIMPGKNPQGCIITIILGVLGAMVGGYIGTPIGWGTVKGFDLRSFGLAVGGALLLLFIYQGLKGNK